MTKNLHRWLWAFLRVMHHWDFAYFLPWLASLPLWLGYPMAQWRGKLHGLIGKDWRSMALGFRHIWRQTERSLQLMFPATSTYQRQKWRAGRYAAEARDEYDAQLIAQKKIDAFTCVMHPSSLANIAHDRKTGLLLLTPHYESALIGIPFLARCGGKINCMTSSVTHDPRVDPAVKAHFDKKYRGLEQYTNSGKFIDMELGMRPFYRMLEAHETLVVLADAPTSSQGVSQLVKFVGATRQLAGGALRMALATNSEISGYLCRCIGPGQYEMYLHPPMSANDPMAIQSIYDFFSKVLYQDPGGWWAVDLLNHMQYLNNEN